LAHEINIPDSATKTDIYNLVLKQIDFLLKDEQNIIANLANITSVLKYSIPEVIWAGFYFFETEKNELILGPFQGKVACTRIKYGAGVCGKALETKETIVVEDVEQFPGHIFCDSTSRSEIVLPILINGNPKGVLDLDSDKIGNFDSIDKNYLEKLVLRIEYMFDNE
jgi:GAF domain-containing protein